MKMSKCADRRIKMSKCDVQMKEWRAFWMECRALLMEYRALSIECRKKNQHE